MSAKEGKTYAEKHGSDAVVDDSIKGEISRRVEDDHIPCAVAFEIAKELKRSPAAVGKTADLLNVRLSKCQLGLFGYKPEKKIVKPLPEVDPEIEADIRASLAGGKLPCRAAWDIAAACNVSKMVVSGTCEAMGLKITGCQLGAF
jgi:hypothetical protein